MLRCIDELLVYERRIGQDGSANIDSWRSLKPVRLPRKKFDGSDFYVGQLRCLCGIVASRDEASDVAKTCFEEKISREFSESAAAYGSPVQLAELADGVWLINCRAVPDLVLLLYADELNLAMKLFLDHTLPTAAIYVNKTQHLFISLYLGRDRKRLHTLEEHLAKDVERAYQRVSCSAEELEGQAEKIAGALALFYKDYTFFKYAQNTVGLNLSKLKKLLNENSLPIAGPIAGWLAALETAGEQLAADDGYFQATLQQSRVMLELIRTRAEIERTKVEEREEVLEKKRNSLINYVSVAIAIGGLFFSLASDDMIKLYLSQEMQIDANKLTFTTIFPYKLLLITLLIVVLIAIRLVQQGLSRRRNARAA